MENNRLVNREKAAEFLGVRPQTLAVWASSRRYALPVVKVGRRAMYRLSDLDAFIERNIVGAEVQQ
jgi:hypothetical protein